MTTERIEKKIRFIATHDKRNPKVKQEIDIVLAELNKISNFSLRDSLEEQLTQACCI